MKLEKKVTLLMCGVLTIVALLVSGVSLYFIKQQTDKEIKDFRDREMANLRTHLKDIVDVGYGVLHSQYEQANDSNHQLEYIKKNLIPDDSLHRAASDDSLLTVYGAQAREGIINEALRILKDSRFDSGNGYFWITNSQLPYPTMIMHAAKPQNEGKVMSAEKYNTEKYDSKNIYQARVEGALAEGEAFVEYVIEKPETGEKEEKISYSRLYKPLGWIISSGVYTDSVAAMAAEMKTEYYNDLRRTYLIIVLATFAALVFASILTYRFTSSIVQMINQVKDRLKRLARGEKVELIQRKAKNEIGEMTESLNNLVEGTNSYVDFAKEIGNGNLTHEFTPLSEQDVLGNELLQMREKLQKTSEEEKQRSWSTQGMAMFGDILRSNQENTVKLCDEVLRALAKYVGINQAAIYLAEERPGGDGVQLVMTSVYAYDRKKFMERTIEIGQGLAGQCYLEKETTVLTEVPDDYLTITSGLGEATPKNIVLFPVKYNDDIFGVMEIASFNVFKDYEVAMIERLCESLASTVGSVRTNETTRDLLEKAQMMADEMKAQEEELRQNQEEMQATQEEMLRNQQELTEENQALKAELDSLKASETTKG
ncbi:cache domain-containing protein [Roseivirga sp. BDSF3-8]|uniref:cache domain-containing protein n=1 Tax=Roseivirga sp. BDSF3-8 TaxID=3241598 RepID=UPI0035318F5A